MEHIVETYDGVAAGKYTIGLGQQEMAVVLDSEDIVSMCMTGYLYSSSCLSLVVAQLMARLDLNPRTIGRLEVGTESNSDRSKSIKSHLMQLFPTDMTDIGGVDNVNACYGGTAALLNSVAWLECGDWDGRLAMVVAGDISIYAKGPARPTGGAGVVAMLIGPDAPIQIERGTAAHYMRHAFDFYKPNPNSEYPIVDGASSILCYLQALDACYAGHLEKITRSGAMAAAPMMEKFDYFAFHSPYGKLVQKSFLRLFYLDYRHGLKDIPDLEEYRSIPIDDTYCDRQLDQCLSRHFTTKFLEKTEPSRFISQRIGNSYCASLYMGLISILCQLSNADIGKRIGMFSYGSGIAATMFSINIVSDPTGVSQSKEELQTLLEQRHKLTAVQVTDLLDERERRFGMADWAPQSCPKSLISGAFYLTGVDGVFRRLYNRI